MIEGRRVAVVLPAYNAEKTLRQTCAEIPAGLVDDLILTDDASTDGTIAVAKELGLHVIVHGSNKGYGANQKSCYSAALERGADIVVMLHPDYQYSPKLVPAMAAMIASGHYDAVFASRILGRGAIDGGMPLYKYVFNRLLTLFQNISWARSSPNIIPAIAPGTVRCLRSCRCSPARTISCSTTR